MRSQQPTDLFDYTNLSFAVPLVAACVDRLTVTFMCSQHTANILFCTFNFAPFSVALTVCDVEPQIIMLQQLRVESSLVLSTTAIHGHRPYYVRVVLVSGSLLNIRWSIAFVIYSSRQIFFIASSSVSVFLSLSFSLAVSIFFSILLALSPHPWFPSTSLLCSALSPSVHRTKNTAHLPVHPTQYICHSRFTVTFHCLKRSCSSASATSRYI